MNDDETKYFLHFYMKAFWELEDDTVSKKKNFALTFCLLFACLLLQKRTSLKLCAKILHFSNGKQGPKK